MPENGDALIVRPARKRRIARGRPKGFLKTIDGAAPSTDSGGVAAKACQ